MKTVLIALIMELVQIVAIIAFAFLAVHFHTWWIALFSLLFIME